MSNHDLTRLLENIGGRDGRLVHLEHTPAREARFGNWPDWTHPELHRAYQSQGVRQPWLHQVQAAEALHAGQHTVIATGTGSGKSLAAWLPVLSDVLHADDAERGLGPGHGRISQHRQRPTALYLSPTKALASDQAHSLETLLRTVSETAGHAGVRVGTCDGDTSLPERDWVRAHGDVVLTNPDFLHFSLLPSHERWTRFLKNLRYVVVDECHAYRGVLGAHVALVLRRLLRLVRALNPSGPGPVVLCASATAADPALTAGRLIGVDPAQVVAVTEDTAPSGSRTLALWQPALKDPWDTSWQEEDEQGNVVNGEHAPRRSALVESSELLIELLAAGAQCLCFVRSRSNAETVAERTRNVLSLRFPELVGAVAAYRGGYLPEERRALEADLRQGRLRALATTNALELGIDIAGLDAVVMAGWPGTRVSLGQQAGRAGRAGLPGLAILVASDNPLDAYLIHHPEDIFDSPEATVFDPSNPHVLAPHLCAAASESPLRETDLELFGLADTSLLEELERRGALRRRPAGWFWNVNIPGRPQDLTNLRGDGPPDLPLVESSSGTVIGTVNGSRAEATAFPGAVYTHQGEHYLVESLTDEEVVVRKKSAIGYRTRSHDVSSVRILRERERETWGNGVQWCFGDVEVTNQVTSYLKLALPGLGVTSNHPLDMPERTLPTTAVWWTIPQEVCEAAGVDAKLLPGALHAAEHASIGLLPLLATCDRWDIGGLSTALHPETMQPTVFVHDGHAGGAGFARRGFETGRRWLEATLETIEQCACEDGCPSCVQSPKCGNNNEPLDKQGAITLLRLLVNSNLKRPADVGSINVSGAD